MSTETPKDRSDIVTHCTNAAKLQPFLLENYFAIHEFSAKYLMSSSDAQSMSMKELLSSATQEQAELWDSLWLGYTEASGSPLVRQQVASSYYPTLSFHNILCFAGAEEGIFCAFQALLEPVDHCIIIAPCYQSLSAIPMSIGCDVTLVDLQPPNWTLQIDDIRRNIRTNTKLLVMNFPHNPTGALLPHETYFEVIALARQFDLWVFSDEVYRGLERDECLQLPTMAETYHKGVSLGVVSKSLGLAGLRIGWVASQSTHALQRMADTKHYLSICNSAPSEILAVIAISNKDTILAKNRAIIANNLGILHAFLDKYSQYFSLCDPVGGCVGFMNYKTEAKRIMPLSLFAEECVTKYGVLILPGTVFPMSSKISPVFDSNVEDASSTGFHVGDYFRFGVGRMNFIDGLKHFENAVVLLFGL